jgi:hypothetical protein
MGEVQVCSLEAEMLYVIQEDNHWVKVFSFVSFVIVKLGA